MEPMVCNSLSTEVEIHFQWLSGDPVASVCRNRDSDDRLVDIFKFLQGVCRMPCDQFKLVIDKQVFVHNDPRAADRFFNFDAVTRGLANAGGQFPSSLSVTLVYQDRHADFERRCRP